MDRTTTHGRATVVQLCRAFGVSRQAYYAAQRAGGEDVGRRRPERAGPWATTAELEAKIPMIIAAQPGFGVRKVWATLRRGGLVASHKRVWAVMHHRGWVLPPIERRDGEAPRGQVAVASSNRRWATDLTTVWTRRDGVAAVVPVVECGDRVLLDVEVTKSQESAAVLAPVERALENVFGDPSKVPDGLELRTDHGPQYTGADCDALCERWRVEHTLAPVGRPTGNAVAERVIQTMKVELIWTRDWESIEELRAAIVIWMKHYNETRPHQALAWQTPAERRAQNLGTELKLAA